MNIGKVCRRNTITVRRFDELAKAAQLMREKHVGYLVVVEPDVGSGTERPIGVLTDRDLVVTVLARGVEPQTLQVGDVMTRQPVAVGESDSLDSALREMRRIGVRRLPVLGQHDELVGVVSLDDVLDVIAGELQNLAGALRNEQSVEGALRP